MQLIKSIAFFIIFFIRPISYNTHPMYFYFFLKNFIIHDRNLGNLIAIIFINLSPPKNNHLPPLTILC